LPYNFIDCFDKDEKDDDKSDTYVLELEEKIKKLENLLEEKDNEISESLYIF
jgi:hypothetical protein